MKAKLLTLLMLIVLAAHGIAQGFVNAGFETPAQPDGYWEYDPTMPGWDFLTVANKGDDGVANGNTPWAYGSHGYKQYAFLQSSPVRNYGHIGQTISGFIIGHRYKVAFYFAKRIQTDGDPLEVTLNGKLIMGLTSPPADASWALLETEVFVAAKVTNTISFIVSPPNGVDRGTVLDDVVLLDIDNPATISSLKLKSTSVNAAASTMGTVTLSQAAGSKGATVMLEVSDPRIASVPNVAFVPAGSKSVSFPISGLNVSAQTQVQVRATYNGYSTALMSIYPAADPTLALKSSSTLGGSSVGASAGTTTTVFEDTKIALSCDLSAASVPVSVTVKANTSSIPFTINTVPVSSDTIAVIKATLNSVSVTRQLTVYAPRVPAISLTPSTIAGGGTSVGKVTLNTPATPSGATVKIYSTNNAVAPVPAFVRFGPGQSAATFPVRTAGVDVSTHAYIRATNDNSSSMATLTVVKAPLYALIPSESSIGGGNPFQAKAVLLGLAGPSGAAVSLSLNTSATTGPSSVKIASQTSAASVTVNTRTVSKSTTVTLSAEYDGVTKTCTVTVNPLTLVSLTLPATAVGGNMIDITVGMNAPAPASGAVVSLTTSSAHVPVPKTVTVPSGSTIVTFSVATKSVTADTQVTVSATYHGVTISKSIKLTPS